MADPVDNQLTVRVRALDDLFVAGEPKPFDEEPNYWPALEHIYRTIKPKRLGRPTRLTVIVPAAEGKQGLAAQTSAAIRRWSELRIEEARSEIAFHRKEGVAKLLLGMLFLAICLGLQQAAEEATFLPDFLQVFLAAGFEILGWVVLWTPIAIFLYDWWPHRQDIGVYEHIANMDVEVVSVDAR